jgi:Pyridoxamine 5'-phosphate oxidase
MLRDLQVILDRSVQQASAFTKKLFADSQWTAERVQQFVNGCRDATIATVSPKGEPHAAVVIAACLDGDIHFSVSHRSALSRHLEHGPHVAFTVTDGTHSAMGRGLAVLEARSLVQPELVERLAAVTRSGSFTPPGWDGLIYRIEIERIFAN